jgi:hypothetical protein
MGSMLPINSGLSGCSMACCECTVQVLSGLVVAVSDASEIIFLPGVIFLSVDYNVASGC